jgi:hypothetical protein
MDDKTSNGAIPLQDAMWRWLPVEVLAPIQAAYEDGQKNARHSHWRDADGTRRSGIDETSDHNRRLIQRHRAALDVAEAQFLAMLRAGRLVAWGRAGSPIAPQRRIPADAWASLRLAHVAEGRAHGAGVELFGLHVAAAVAPVEPAPVVPSPPEPVMSAESPPARASPKQAYSPEAMGAWFYLRVQTWPKGEPPPSEADCIAAAQSYFDDAPGRDAIRPIRQTKTPDSWRKRGPKPRR